jgi:hypothetical protein
MCKKITRHLKLWLLVCKCWEKKRREKSNSIKPSSGGAGHRRRRNSHHTRCKEGKGNVSSALDPFAFVILYIYLTHFLSPQTAYIKLSFPNSIGESFLLLFLGGLFLSTLRARERREKPKSRGMTFQSTR